MTAEREKIVADREALRIEVTEEDLYLAMSELYNMGEFELVGGAGRVVLVAKDWGDSEGDDDVCDECKNSIRAEDGGSLANEQHEESCSLYTKEKN